LTLGFYAGVLAILDSASLIAVAVLAQTHTMTWLIPWVLVFAAAVFLLLVGGVFTVNLFDPAKLMLGQISGSEYVAIHAMPLGDSVSGEHMIVVEKQEAMYLQGAAEALPPPAPEKSESGAS